MSRAVSTSRLDSRHCRNSLAFLQIADLTTLRAVASSDPETYRSYITERLHTILGWCLSHGHSMSDKEAKLFSLLKKMSTIITPLARTQSPTPSLCSASDEYEESGESYSAGGDSSDDSEGQSAQ